MVPILSERLKEMALLEECYDDSVFVEIGHCYELVCNMQNRKKAQAISSLKKSQNYLTTTGGSQFKS